MRLKYKLFGLVAVIIGLYTSFLIGVLIPRLEKELVFLEKRNAQALLNEAVMLVDKSGQDLKAFEQEALNDYKRELRDLVDVVHSLFRALKQTTAFSQIREEELKKELFELLTHLRYDQNNDVFAVDYNYTTLSHPFIAKGTDMRTLKDPYGNPVVTRFVDLAKTKGEGYVRYWWPRLPGDAVPSEKLTYSRNCRDWNMVVGTGIYIDDIRREIAKRREDLIRHLRNVIGTIRIGKHGYLFVFDENKVLIHPNRDMEGKPIDAFRDPTDGTPLYRKLIAAAKSQGEVYYTWNRPDDKDHYIYKKVSWVRYVPSMRMYVASSAYLDEFEILAHALRTQIYLMALLLLVLVLFISGFAVRRILSPLAKLKTAAQKISAGDLSVRTRIRSGDELESLSYAFDFMVARLERQIAQLDKTVAKKTEALRKLAVTDGLTGLYNRRYFHESSRALCALAKRKHRTMSVMMIDIDDFKRINDTYGHLKGDEVIVQVASVILQEIRRSDIACRYGGEEFVVLMPETPLNGAVELAQRIRIEIAKRRVPTSEGSIRFSVSIGVAQCDIQNDTHIEEAVNRADEALYKAKKEGKNRVETS